MLAEVVRAEPGACLSLTAKRADGSAAEVELPLEEGSPAGGWGRRGDGCWGSRECAHQQWPPI